MCFDYDFAPTVYREQHVTARKHHRCCECGLLICPGEIYQSYFGIWDRRPETYKTCAVCEWFRERVAAAEMEHGCRVDEAYPALGLLWQALGDGYAQDIGLVDLDDWHEREEAIA